MKLPIPKALLVCMFLSSCAQTQVPYKVVKVVEHESRLLPVQFPVGITQEKLDENKYRITAKLAELGTHKRARSMAFYHASILAETNGYDAFIVNEIKKPSWCVRSRNRNIGGVAWVNGGPTAKLTVTLVDVNKLQQSEKRKNLYLVENTKDSNKALMDIVPTEIELEQTSAERLEYCQSRLNKTRIRS